MSEKPLKISHPLYILLVEKQLDDFSIKDLVRLIEEQFGANFFGELSYTQIYNLLYNNIYRLLKKQLLTSYHEESKGTRFKKTLVFSQTKFSYDQLSTSSDKDREISQRPLTQEKLIAELKTSLGMKEKDLQTTLSEVEEYKLMFAKYPGLKEAIAVNYENAVEEISRLYGKIKAIETVLNQMKYGGSGCC
ncbi:hypothetical protein LIN78_16140 [Leeia sp. TBRC 13508]|uniref:Uncharacterized protein n=1 Tax=Leeia speluncae TaxID=2884804 RepID=A0ABS8DA37_9NEIS|nr:hypothetical protein [Leeia speluncae]MCB6185078.1 hypothetical protein [Leeia speluncae]